MISWRDVLASNKIDTESIKCCDISVESVASLIGSVKQKLFLIKRILSDINNPSNSGTSLKYFTKAFCRSVYSLRNVCKEECFELGNEGHWAAFVAIHVRSYALKIFVRRVWSDGDVNSDWLFDKISKLVGRIYKRMIKDLFNLDHK